MQPIAAPLLQWFDANKRLLPFRQEPSAYHIWVSEIMLQQTRVAAAIPYYERFIAALPDPAALAACEPDALRKLWQGLGYYNRVNNMQKAARIVCEQYGGDLPADYDALRSLPGIGDYTAGAVASIAAMWLRELVTPNARLVLSLLLASAAVVCLVSALATNAADNQNPAQPNQSGQMQQGSTSGNNLDVNLTATDTPNPAPTPTATE